MNGKYKLMIKGLALLGIVGLLSSCGGGSGGGGATTLNQTASLGNAVKNVQLTEGNQSEITGTYTIPGSITSGGDYSIDLAGTLQNVTLSANEVPKNSQVFRVLETLRLLASAVISDAIADSHDTAQLTVYLSYAGDPNVCSSAIVFGPYSITGAIGAALTSSTSTVTPTQPAVDIINTGSIEYCIVTTPPVDAYLTVTGIEVDFEPCASPTVSIADTTWEGIFHCTNFGTSSTPPEGEFISLDITKNPDGSYHYNDGVADFNGHLCGNKFKFNGSGVDYTESGTLVFSSDTKAEKTAIWNSIPPGPSGGSCTDMLDRILIVPDA